MFPREKPQDMGRDGVGVGHDQVAPGVVPRAQDNGWVWKHPHESCLTLTGKSRKGDTPVGRAQTGQQTQPRDLRRAPLRVGRRDSQPVQEKDSSHNGRVWCPGGQENFKTGGMNSCQKREHISTSVQSSPKLSLPFHRQIRGIIKWFCFFNKYMALPKGGGLATVVGHQGPKKHTGQM